MPFLKKQNFHDGKSFKKVTWRVNGNHYGTKTLEGDDSGQLNKK